MVIELLPQCYLFVDNGIDLFGLGRVGLNSDEASVLMAKQIIPTRLLIAPNSERLVSVEAIGELSTNGSVNELFACVLYGSHAILD